MRKSFLGAVGAAALAAASSSAAAAAPPQAALPVTPTAIAIRVDAPPNMSLLRVDAALTFVPGPGVERIDFRFRPDLQLDVVEDADGVPLVYERRRNRVTVSSRRLPAGTPVTWNFRYRIRLGQTLDRREQVFSATPWYPFVQYETVDEDFPRNVPVRATVTASVRRPWVLVAAGSLTQSEADDDTVVYRWSDPIPTPLIPLLIAPFQRHSVHKDFGDFQGFFTRTDRSLAVSYLDYMASAAEFYTATIGAHRRRDFTLVSLDLPDEVGGLTVPGITVMRARDLAAGAPFPYRIFAHEVAHHWWNDNARIPRRADGWLREGLPTYSALLYLASAYGDSMMRQELDRSRRVALSVDSPVPLEHSDDLESPEETYALNYHKAAFVLHMLRTVLGPEDFLRLLRGLHANDEPITSGRIVGAAQALYGADLSWFFASWVAGATIPSFAIKYRYEQRAGETYEPYLLSGTIEQRDAAIRHPVLLRIVLEGAPPLEQVVWVEPGETAFSIGLPAPPAGVEFDPLGDLLHRGATVEEIAAR